MPYHLSALYEHPLKSGRGNLVDRAAVEPEGLRHDRRFLAHTPDGTFITGRSHPRLVLITAGWDAATLRLGAPGREGFLLAPSSSVEAPVTVWKDRFPAWDQGEAAAAWLSDFLGEPLRLAWLGRSRRTLRWDRDRTVTFADAAPCLAIGSASLAELSRRVGEPLSMRRFRPNFVVDGAQPFEEDTWRRLRIGGVEFLNLDGCGRCEFTTIDPETAERHLHNQPVATLETFRRVDTGIYFGMNLMPLGPGTVHVGDPVTVLETRRPLFFGSRRPVDVALELWKVEPRWPEGPAPLRCTEVRDEAPGVKTFQFVRADGRRFSWDPGQYLTLKIDRDEGPVRRSYTLSGPEGGDALEITVKRLDDGTVSPWFHDHVTVGSTLVGEAVGGSFTLRDHPWDSVLLLGAGTGVTPLIALARSVADHDLPVDVAVHLSFRTRSDVLFAREWESLAARLGSRLTLAIRTTSEEGRLDHQGLVKFCPDLRDRKAFVCGPNDYRAAMRALLSGAGFKVDRRYHEELFGEAALEVPGDAVPGEVTFARTGKTVASDGKTTVLQLVERAGIDLPSSCRSGDCGICRVKTAAGEWFLACHTFPKGNLVLDL